MGFVRLFFYQIQGEFSRTSISRLLLDWFLAAAGMRHNRDGAQRGAIAIFFGSRAVPPTNGALPRALVWVGYGGGKIAKVVGYGVRCERAGGCGGGRMVVGFPGGRGRTGRSNGGWSPRDSRFRGNNSRLTLQKFPVEAATGIRSQAVDIARSSGSKITLSRRISRIFPVFGRKWDRPTAFSVRRGC
jgi:hypothetical protein